MTQDAPTPNVEADTAGNPAPKAQVSVIVPVHNGAVYLGDCLASILGQTHGALEVLVIDDGSDDGLGDGFAQVAGDVRVRMMHHATRQGAAVARNTGLQAATGRYIAFCDCDDLWAPDKLEAQLDALRASGAAACHTSVYYVGETWRVRRAAKPVVRLDDMRIRNWIANSSGIYDTKRVGKILQQPHVHEDYAMWCALLAEGHHSVGVDAPLAQITRRSTSQSGNKLQSLAWHLAAQRRIFAMSAPEQALRLAQNAWSRMIASREGAR